MNKPGLRFAMHDALRVPRTVSAGRARTSIG